MVEGIPNIKKLRIRVDNGESPDCFNNLENLHALQHLNCQFVYLENAITFPHSLKKLTLQSNGFSWEELTAMISPLPYLEVLKLEWISSVGSWRKTADGQFRSLKYYLLNNVLIWYGGRQTWTTFHVLSIFVLNTWTSWRRFL